MQVWAAVYSIGNDFFQPDPEERALQVKAMLEAVDVANALEVGLMRVFSGNAKEGYSLEDGLEWIVDGLIKSAQYASRHGVVLALENHGLMAGRSDQVRGIIDAVGISRRCAPTWTPATSCGKPESH